MNFNGLLGGMGLLLFGLYIFEEMLKFLGGRNLRRIIVKFTTGSWQSLLVGMILAGIFSSSSLLTILVIALTGAGLMPLKNAIGIVLGSNIGTTFDDFLIAWLGFGSGIDIGAFALPMVGVAGIVSILTKNDHVRNIAKLFFGFGLIFIGLFFIKQTASGIESHLSLERFHSMPLIVFGLLGMGVTAAVQLMGVVALMTFTALDAGIITFPASIAILMGANIGATLNAVLASLGGRTIKRQVALSHVLFNGISTLIGAIFFRQFIRLTHNVFGFAEDVVGSAFFNVIFNLSTAVLFGFILTPFTKLIERLIPANEESTKLTVEQFSIHELDASSTEAVITALSNDVVSMTHLLIAYVFKRLGIEKEEAPQIYSRLHQGIFKKYVNDDEATLTEGFEEKTGMLLKYYLHVSRYRLRTSQLESLNELYKALNALIKCKKTFDLCVTEIKQLKENHADEIVALYTTLINKIRSGMYALLLLLQNNDTTMANELSALESQWSTLQDLVRKNIADLMKGGKEETPVTDLLTITTYLPLTLTYMLGAVKHHLNAKSDPSGFPKW